MDNVKKSKKHKKHKGKSEHVIEDESVIDSTKTRKAKDHKNNQEIYGLHLTGISPHHQDLHAPEKREDLTDVENRRKKKKRKDKQKHIEEKEGVDIVIDDTECTKHGCKNKANGNLNTKKKKKEKKKKEEQDTCTAAGQEKERPKQKYRVEYADNEENGTIEKIVKRKKKKKKHLEKNQEPDTCIVETEKEKRHKRKRPTDANEDINGSDENHSKQKEKKKKKHHKNQVADEREDEETNVSDVLGNFAMKKKKKKKKHKCDDSTNTNNISDNIAETNSFTDAKGEGRNGKEKKKDSDDTNEQNVPVGQWATADLGSSERQSKFLRLMGGLKKGSLDTHTNIKQTVSGGSVPKFNSALNSSQENKLGRALENQFEQAITFSLSRRDHKTGGLGFQIPPEANKKFHIDVNKTKSKVFDD